MRPTHSLVWKTAISHNAIMRSWTGLVLPSTAPNEMSTAAAAKSENSMLRNKHSYEQRSMFIDILIPCFTLQMQEELGEHSPPPKPSTSNTVYDRNDENQFKKS